MEGKFSNIRSSIWRRSIRDIVRHSIVLGGGVLAGEVLGRRIYGGLLGDIGGLLKGGLLGEGFKIYSLKPSIISSCLCP